MYHRFGALSSVAAEGKRPPPADKGKGERTDHKRAHNMATTTMTTTAIARTAVDATVSFTSQGAGIMMAGDPYHFLKEMGALPTPLPPPFALDDARASFAVGFNGARELGLQSALSSARSPNDNENAPNGNIILDENPPNGIIINKNGRDANDANRNEHENALLVHAPAATTTTQQLKSFLDGLGLLSFAQSYDEARSGDLGLPPPPGPVPSSSATASVSTDGKMNDDGCNNTERRGSDEGGAEEEQEEGRRRSSCSSASASSSSSSSDEMTTTSGAGSVTSNTNANAAAADSAMAAVKKAERALKRSPVRHDYHDHAHEEDSADDGKQAGGGEHHRRRRHRPTPTPSYRHAPFPSKLHDILSLSDEEATYSSCVGWMSHGRCFRVSDPDAFARDVMPRHFRHRKISSFMRQLNLYGFLRLTRGDDAGCYYHEFFLRGRPNLARKVTRTVVRGTGARMPFNPDGEPNFYKMIPLPPPPPPSPPPLAAAVAAARGLDVPAAVSSSVAGLTTGRSFVDALWNNYTKDPRWAAAAAKAASGTAATPATATSLSPSAPPTTAPPAGATTAALSALPAALVGKTPLHRPAALPAPGEPPPPPPTSPHANNNAATTTLGAEGALQRLTAMRRDYFAKKAGEALLTLRLNEVGVDRGQVTPSSAAAPIPAPSSPAILNATASTLGAVRRPCSGSAPGAAAAAQQHRATAATSANSAPPKVAFASSAPSLVVSTTSSAAFRPPPSALNAPDYTNVPCGGGVNLAAGAAAATANGLNASLLGKLNNASVLSQRLLKGSVLPGSDAAPTRTSNSLKKSCEDKPKTKRRRRQKGAAGGKKDANSGGGKRRKNPATSGESGGKSRRVNGADRYGSGSDNSGRRSRSSSDGSGGSTCSLDDLLRIFEDECWGKKKGHRCCSATDASLGAGAGTGSPSEAETPPDADPLDDDRRRMAEAAKEQRAAMDRLFLIEPSLGEEKETGEENDSSGGGGLLGAGGTTDLGTALSSASGYCGSTPGVIGSCSRHFISASSGSLGTECATAAADVSTNCSLKDGSAERMRSTCSSSSSSPQSWNAASASALAGVRSSPTKSKMQRFAARSA